MMTRTASIATLVAAGLAFGGCDPVRLEPVRVDRHAIAETGGGGGTTGEGGAGGDSSAGGSSGALLPGPSIAFHGADLPPDPDGPAQWSDLVPTDPNVYLVVGTAGMSCAAPWQLGIVGATPIADEMVIEVPPEQQHPGVVDLHTIRSTFATNFPCDANECTGVNNRGGHYPSGQLVILAIDEGSVTFEIVGSTLTYPEGTVDFDGAYATSFCR